MLAGLGCVVNGPLYVPIGVFDIAGNYRATDEAAVNKAAELKRERENAQIRETGIRLGREHQAAQARKPSKCTASPSDVIAAERLDPAMISDAVAKVKTQVMSCRDQSLVKGQVLVSVNVAAEGCVNTVTVKSTLDPAVGSCVATAIRQATFARTQSGGSFRYPFVF